MGGPENEQILYNFLPGIVAWSQHQSHFIQAKA
jgi:hypothetical protein